MGDEKKTRDWVRPNRVDAGRPEPDRRECRADGHKAAAISTLREDYAARVPQKFADLATALTEADGVDDPRQILQGVRAVAHMMSGTGGSVGLHLVGKVAAAMAETVQEELQQLEAGRKGRSGRSTAARQDHGDAAASETPTDNRDPAPPADARHSQWATILLVDD